MQKSLVETLQVDKLATLDVGALEKTLRELIASRGEERQLKEKDRQDALYKMLLCCHYRNFWPFWLK